MIAMLVWLTVPFAVRQNPQHAQATSSTRIVETVARSLPQNAVLALLPCHCLTSAQSSPTLQDAPLAFRNPCSWKRARIHCQRRSGASNLGMDMSPVTL